MSTPASPRAQFLWLTSAHAIIDAYALSVPFLLPILLTRLAPDDQRELYAGLLAATAAASTSLGQILFAFLADRRPSIWFLSGGLMVGAVGMSLLGLAPTLPIAFLVILVGGMGVASFHPQSTATVGRIASKARGFGISFFITGGNVGQAVGPLALMYALTLFGSSVFLPAMIPGLLIALVVWRSVNVSHDRPIHAAVTERRPLAPIPYKPLIVLFLLVALRTVTLTGFLTFMSLFLEDLHLSDMARSGVLSGFLLFGSIGMLVGGSLSDRFPRIPLLAASILIPVPLFVGAIYTHGAMFVALLLVGNFIFQFSTPIYIVLGQETMPDRVNVASSIVMGAAWGTAGLMNIPIGAIANQIGLQTTLIGIGLLPAVASVLLFLLPKESKRVVDAQAA
ncbi:MAG: MFS transporter [Candidatus Poribacteria bacterium]|nr:MFS transporter [Candidatus Poribacteria bacterium]